MTESSPLQPSRTGDNPDTAPDDLAVPGVLSFNGVDPTGAGGLTGDALTVASVGAHLLPVGTGQWLRDSRETAAFLGLDDALVAEQARLVAEDMQLQVVKAGFLGSAENVAAVAAFAADYADLPVVAYMPDLTWWDEQDIDSYLDAFRSLLLPQTAVLVGNNSTLRHWLLPESSTRAQSSVTDLARAAAEWGVPFVLATGVSQADGQIGCVLASAKEELAALQVERIEARFLGAGDTLSAALAGLLACGTPLEEAALQAMQYLDQALDHGFHPGMGRALPDRLFWAQPDDEDDADAADASTTESSFAGEASLRDLLISTHETKH